MTNESDRGSSDRPEPQPSATPGAAPAIGRRTFLTGAGVGAAVLTTPSFARGSGFEKLPWPFTLGVASGDPLPDAVVIWTRLAPRPQEPGGGVSPSPQFVFWQVARDERFLHLERFGVTFAHPQDGHAVHVDVQGLRPGRTYYYRFWAGGHFSPVGRTKTAPRYGRPVDRLRYAFASCQHFEQGYYTAYKHMADEDLDFVVFLGDYIYENPPTLRVRAHTGVGEPLDVDGYRARHAVYRSDPHLQAAHAAFPWLVTFDDHEVDNDWSGEHPQDPDLQSKEAFLARRAAAFQVYWEHMPVRSISRPRGPHIQIYRRFTFGKLAEFNVLDTRQFRSITKPCGVGSGPVCPALLDPSRTMLGADQENWLLDGLHGSSAQWNVLAQQVPFAFVDVGQTEEVAVRQDKWDAYPTARQRVVDFLVAHRPKNPVVITGDLHNAWTQVIKANHADPAAAPVATEFVGSSISSGGDGTDQTTTAPIVLAKNPHVLFNSNRRGYVSVEITDGSWRSDFRTVPFVTTEGAPLHTTASFVIESGNPVPYRA